MTIRMYHRSLARRFVPTPGVVTGPVRDAVTLVYATQAAPDTWIALEGATFSDGAQIKIGAIIDFGGAGTRNTPLSDYTATSAGSRIEWFKGVPGSGGTLFTYGGGTPRTDDWVVPYDVQPAAALMTTDVLGGPGARAVTARCRYPDGHLDDHVANFTVTVPALTIQSGPTASPTASSAIISVTTSTRVASMTVQYRVTGGPGTWSSVTNAGQDTTSPSVLLQNLSSQTGYDFRITAITDIHNQTIDDLTVRTFTTPATAPPPSGGGGGLPVPSPFDALIPNGFLKSSTFSSVYDESKMSTVGAQTVSASDTLIENLKVTGVLTITGKRVSVRNCWAQAGIVFNGDAVHGLVEHSRIGPASTYATLIAPTVIGGNTIDLDQQLPDGSYILASSANTYQETMRVKSSTSVAGGFRHTLERWDANNADVIQIATAKWLVVHPTGAKVSWHNVSLHGSVPGNGIGGTQGNTGQTSDTESRENPRNYTVRNCFIAKVNDGIKFGCGLIKDTVIMEQIFIPPAHLDGAQWTGGDEGAANGLGARWIHNTLLMTADGNRPFQIADNQTTLYGPFPASGMHFSFNFTAAAQGPTIGDNELWKYNRWGHAQRKGNNTSPPVVQKVHSYVTIETGFAGTLIDNLCIDDGSPITSGTGSVSGTRDNSGAAVGHNNPARWAPGYSSSPYYETRFGHPDGTGSTP